MEDFNTIRCRDCSEKLPLTVCRSNAGYYIGRHCPKCGPYSRDSGYFATRGHAEAELLEWNKLVENPEPSKFPELEENLQKVKTECLQAMRDWPPYNSAHEAYGVLMEEVEEFWDHVKTNQKRRDLPNMKKEAIQIAAVALRIATEVCGEERGRK